MKHHMMHKSAHHSGKDAPHGRGHRGSCGCHGEESHGDRRHARRPSWLEDGEPLMGGPGGRGGRGHGGGHRLGRLFAHGDLSLVVLRLLTDKPRHGYEIIKAIEEMTNGVYAPSPGTVYPALTLLEEQGFVTVTASDGTKKLHSLTPEGQQHLDANQAELKTLLAKIAFAGQRAEHGPSPRVVRAMENLKMALRLRLGGEPLSDDQLQAVVDVLDQAARDIERA